MSKKLTLPQFIEEVLQTLRDANHQAYVVGGAIRDLLMGNTTTDWDLATDATPEQIQALFADHVYENEFGTVTLKCVSENSPNAVVPVGQKVEITPFRSEHGYADKRRPDTVQFGVSLKEDLSRRDFTINAIAYDGTALVDPFNGRDDIAQKIIRTVGSPDERLTEDALRMLRAIRFATTLGFTIDPQTQESIKKHSKAITQISAERIRDELIKIVEAHTKPSTGFRLMHDTGLLAYIMPELEVGIGVGQNKHHIYTVFEHNLLSLDFAAEYEYSTAVRLAALLHDIGKPATKEGEGHDCTFYNHAQVGAKQARDILIRLKLPKALGKKIVTLVRNHMFFYDVDAVTDAAIRRLVKKVGPENIQDLLKVRIAERKGSGVPKARPYRLRHLEYMIEKVARDPISVKMLKLNGDIMINEFDMKPGPRMGWILNALLEDVLDDPTRNTREYLEARMKELDAMSDDQLSALAQAGKEAAAQKEAQALGEIKKKFHVK